MFNPWSWFWGWTLRTAASYNALRLVKLALYLGADIDSQSSNEYTALHRAAQYGATEVVNYLLEKGANYELRTQTLEKTDLDMALENYELGIQTLEKTALDIALENNTIHHLPSLWNYGSSGVSGYALIKTSSEKSILWLLDMITDPRLKADWLYYAAKKGHTTPMKLLIDAGVNINGLHGEMVPLMGAIESVKTKAVEFLLEKGADVNVQAYRKASEMEQDDKKTTPIAWVFYKLNNTHTNGILRILLEKGANRMIIPPHPHHGDHEVDILYYACLLGESKVVQTILDFEYKQYQQGIQPPSELRYSLHNNDDIKNVLNQLEGVKRRCTEESFNKCKTALASHIARVEQLFQPAQNGAQLTAENAIAATSTRQAEEVTLG
jgi:hypothetical protein